MFFTSLDDGKITPSSPTDDESGKAEAVECKDTKIAQPQTGGEFEVVNVSLGLQHHTVYKKLRPSKLDGLLERRVKQFSLEERQRLERLKQLPASENGKDQDANSASDPDLQTQLSSHERAPDFTSVVKKLEFDQDDRDSGATSSEQDRTSEPENGTFSSTEPTELNGGSGKDLENVSSKTQRPRFEGADERSAPGAGSSTENGFNSQKSLHVNGDVSIESPPADPPLMDSFTSQKVTPDVAKDTVKSMMNGDLTQQGQNDKTKLIGAQSDLEPRPCTKVDPQETAEGSPAVASLQTVEEEKPKSPSVDGGGGGVTTQTIITQVTTTTTTVSTKSNSNLSTSSSSSSMTSTTTTTTQRTSSSTCSTKVTQENKTVFTATKTSASGSSLISVTVSKEYSSRDRVRLMKFSRIKKTRSGTALPSYRKFVTKSSKKSIFVLPNDELKKLARRAGIREVPIFNYNAKPASDIWPYPSPRPTFGITWRFVQPQPYKCSCLDTN